MRAAILVLSLLSSTAAIAQPVDWSRYSDSQLGLAVDIPREIFSVDAGKTQKLTGRLFKTADGRADLSVYSIDNDARESPADFMRTRFVLSNTSTYRRVTSQIQAVSGYRGDKIWYARCNFASLRVVCVALNYPASEKRNWDAIVTRISNTLSKPG